MYHVGFTGTQKGMTTDQRDVLTNLLVCSNSTFHHGDCVGADEEADAIARKAGFRIHLHPPINDSKRAFCGNADDMREPPKPYMERNEDIVAVSGILFATPSGPEDQNPRSGTWATIRRAIKRGIVVIIIMPDGSARLI